MAIKRIVAGLVVGGVAVFAGTTATEDKTKRGDDGEILESGGLGVFKVQVGDCVRVPSEAAEIYESVEGVPCSEPHDGQVFAEYNLPDGEFNATAVENQSMSGCIDRFQAAIGRSYDEAEELDVTGLFPSKESWEQMDDREVSCFVISVDGSPRVGSDLPS